MLLIQPFLWRRLTPNAALEHCLDESGALLLRDPTNLNAPPLATAIVRDVHGDSRRVPLHALGFGWTQAANGDGWMLRTEGPPVTMANVVTRWDAIVRQVSDATGVDERLLFVTIASEVHDASPDADDQVKAPRTLNGYPKRQGDRDPGDFARDLEDWTGFVTAGSRGVTHSSHGLMQTPISTALSVRRALFDGVDPSLYRAVLWDPSKSIECGAAFLATFPALVQTDPLAARVAYASRGIRPTPSSRWGAAIEDELVPLVFVALWNDDASLRAGESLASPGALAKTEPTFRPWWLVVALACGCTCFWLSYLAAKQKAAAEADDEHGAPDLASREGRARALTA